MVSWTNRRGQTVTKTYDVMDRDSSMTVDGLTTSYFYSPQGRFSGTIRGVNRDTIKTDLAGRPDTVVSVRNGRVYSQVIGFAGNGQRATHRLLAANEYDELTESTYDGRDWLKTLTDPSLLPTSLDYNLDGAVIRRGAPGLATI